MSTKQETEIQEQGDVFGDATQEAQTFAEKYVDAIGVYGKQQDQLLAEQGDYLVSQLEQQKAKAEQSYTQEQSAAYTDYQKQVDPYGAQAEQMAESGLSNSGYAESLKTQAYVAFQNRMAVNRQSYQDAVTSFNNAFTEAKMQNDSQRATLAYQTLMSQLEFIIGTSVSEDQTYQQYSQWSSVAKGATTRNKAMDILSSYGVSSKPMSRAEWRSNKQGYDNYEYYLQAFVANALKSQYR